MAQKVLNLNALFGDKPIYRSLTAWGLMVFVGLSAAVAQAGDSGVFPAETVERVTTWLEYIGGTMVALGIRRAATAQDVAS